MSEPLVYEKSKARTPISFSWSPETIAALEAYAATQTAEYYKPSRSQVAERLLLLGLETQCKRQWDSENG